MKPTDRYLSGDFDGDGRADLLAISTNGWVHLIRYAMTDSPLHRLAHQRTSSGSTTTIAAADAVSEERADALRRGPRPRLTRV
jgi:hypothetical protein